MFEQQVRMLFNNELFKERFKLVRDEYGISITDLSRYCTFSNVFSIDASTFSYWESGKRKPTFDSINFVADILGIAIDWLAGRSEDMYKEDIIRRLEPNSFPVVLMINDEKIELPINIPEDYVNEELRKSAYSLELRARINFLIFAILKEYEFSRNFNTKKIKGYVEILNNIFTEKTIVVKKEDNKKVFDKNVDTIGSKLKSLRSDKGLTLAEMVSLSPIFTKSSISFWENDERIPSCIVIAEYARVFRVTADWILGVTNEKEP